MIFVAGPGHGAPGVLGPAYLEGTYSEIYPDKSEDADGMRKFFKQFSFPGDIGSHVHARDAGLDPRRRRARLQPVARLRHGVRQPDLIVAVRGRRRRSRDRSARDVVALQQVPEPDPRRRRAADPEPQRLQDQQPDDAARASATRSSKRCSWATATRRTSSKAATRRRCTRQMAATLDAACRRDPRAPEGSARSRTRRSGRAGR